MTTINPVQYKLSEFIRLLEHVATDKDQSFHCSDSTYTTISKLLETEYDEKEDDLEYLMDIVNISLEHTGCTNKKRFPVSKYLDWACSNNLYIHNVALQS